jgi:hypothetical protein
MCGSICGKIINNVTRGVRKCHREDNKIYFLYERAEMIIENWYTQSGDQDEGRLHISSGRILFVDNDELSLS